ncbi:MAG: hypothetical protein RL711_1503, partial [Bacteroidota bacterium]
SSFEKYWIDKFFLEQKSISNPFIENPDTFYSKVRATGFIYGYIISLQTPIFVDNKGWTEDEITKVHKKLCPKSDVLSPIAYIGKCYHVETKADGTLRFDREPSQGVSVEIKGFEDEDTKLLIMPSPLRLLLIINDKTQK